MQIQICSRFRSVQMKQNADQPLQAASQWSARGMFALQELFLSSSPYLQGAFAGGCQW